MATKLETIERDGRLVHVYDNGLELDAATGHIIRRPDHVAFTSETGKSAAKKRQEKMRRLLRAGIVRAHNSIMPSQVKNSAAAFAAALEMLWEQVVLNSEAYPRDRTELIREVGKMTELVPDKRDSEDDNRPALLNAAAVGAGTAALMAKILGDVIKEQRRQEQERLKADKVIDG